MKHVWRFLAPLVVVGGFFLYRCSRDWEADNAAKMATPTSEYDEVLRRFPAPATRPAADD
jgi:hypothetical protein